MLYHTHLISAIQDKRNDFIRFDQDWNTDVNRYAKYVRLLGNVSSKEVEKTINKLKSPGAVPSNETDSHGSIVVKFKERWKSHEEARRWAIGTLKDRMTFAVDGSQILPGKELSIPTAAIQIALFENPHTIKGDYRKETRFFILTPQELIQRNDRSNTEDPESIVSFRRFNEEIEALCVFLEKNAGWKKRGEKMPVAFFDGSLLISHTHSRTQTQDKYVEAILNLIEISRYAEIPVIGFIDQSYARDLVHFVEVYFSIDKCSTVYDAQILRAHTDEGGPLFNDWGDRSIFFNCFRGGLTNDFIDKEGKSLIGFVYLQTSSNHTPARLDIPTWVYQAGLLDTVIDSVRAECVVGNGYPYAIETADAAAVITLSDREMFMRAIQEFARRENLAFNLSKKSASKAHRR